MQYLSQYNTRQNTTQALNITSYFLLKRQAQQHSLEDNRGGMVMVGVWKVEFSAEGLLEAHGGQILQLELWESVLINPRDP